jgi:CBS domain-containing protein/ribosome-associated translation inhibitor RaiA
MDITPLIKEDFLQFEDTATLSEIIGKLRQFEKRAGLVFQNKKYLGLVEKGNLLRPNVNLHETVIDGHIQRTPILSATTELIEVARLMAENNVDSIPIEEEKKIIGVVRSFDVAVALADEIDKLKVKDVKFIKPPKINSKDPLSTAVEIMQTQKIDHLPVYREGELTSIVGLKDIIRKIINWSPKRDVSEKFNSEMHSTAAQTDSNRFTSLPIENFVTDDLVSIQTNDLLSNAVLVMQDKNVTSLLVMEGDQYQGMLSLRTILSSIAKLNKVQKFSVNFVGLHGVNLTEHQQTVLRDITNRNAEKLQRKINQEFSVNIHLKEINADGKQRRFEAKLKIELPGKLLTSEKSDWDLETAIHKCFNIVEGQVYEK